MSIFASDEVGQMDSSAVLQLQHARWRNLKLLIHLRKVLDTTMNTKRFVCHLVILLELPHTSFFVLFRTDQNIDQLRLGDKLCRQCRKHFYIHHYKHVASMHRLKITANLSQYYFPATTFIARKK